MSLTGKRGSIFVVRSPLIDQATGMECADGHPRRPNRNGARLGVGTTVEVSLFDTSLALMRYNMQTLWEQGVQPKRCGTSHESLCPYGIFDAADGSLLSSKRSQ